MGPEHERRRKFRSWGDRKASVRSGRFRDSLSVALVIVSLRERETLIGTAPCPPFFGKEWENNSFKFKVAV